MAGDQWSPLRWVRGLSGGVVSMFLTILQSTPLTASFTQGRLSLRQGFERADSRGRRVACPAGKNVDNVFKDEMSKRISPAFAVTEGKVHLALPETCQRS